jgi:hypothetical protein
MNGSPWMGVLFIASTFGGALLFIMLLLKAEGLRNALTQTFRWPLFVAIVVGGFGASAFMVRYGVGSNPMLPLLFAIHLFIAADAPRQAWARWLIWLDAAVLAGVTSLLWLDGREFSDGHLIVKVITVLALSLILWAGRASFFKIQRPQNTIAAETGTPA